MQNRFSIRTAEELAEVEERLSKAKAVELFDQGLLETFPVGSIAGLAAIHGHLFGDLYDFSGRKCTENSAKSGFLFAPARFLGTAVEQIGRMPQSTYDQIAENAWR